MHRTAESSGSPLLCRDFTPELGQATLEFPAVVAPLQVTRDPSFLQQEEKVGRRVVGTVEEGERRSIQFVLDDDVSSMFAGES